MRAILVLVALVGLPVFVMSLYKWLVEYWQANCHGCYVDSLRHGNLRMPNGAVTGTYLRHTCWRFWREFHA